MLITIVKKLRHIKIPNILYISFFFVFVGTSVFLLYQKKQLTDQIKALQANERILQKQLTTIAKDFNDLKSQDQIAINQKNTDEIEQINKTYNKTISVYEKLLELKTKSKNTENLDDSFAKILDALADKQYASAEASLITFEKQIQTENEKIATSFTIPKNIATSNSAPSGYAKQQVTTEIGNFLVDLVAGDLSTTRVIVDTASDGDCRDNCPVLPLSDYVSRNSAYAGINGSYFCPASYPSCAGKTNSFDTLLMNKNKKYFNSDNNVYSTVPAVIFLGNSVRFVGRSLDWGRDSGIDSMIANQPLLLSGGNITFGGDSDPKKGSKGPRSFVANKGNTVFIGVVHNATVAEAAYVLKALGMENGLNLDSGGSTALWNGGYKVGPGRNIPNAILFIRK